MATYEIIQPPSTEELADLAHKSIPLGKMSVTIQMDGEEQGLTIRLNEIIPNSNGIRIGGRDSMGSWVEINGQLGQAATLSSQGLTIF